MHHVRRTHNRFVFSRWHLRPGTRSRPVLLTGILRMALCNAHCFTHALHFSALLARYLLKVSNLDTVRNVGLLCDCHRLVPPIPTPRYPLPCPLITGGLHLHWHDWYCPSRVDSHRALRGRHPTANHVQGWLPHQLHPWSIHRQPFSYTSHCQPARRPPLVHSGPCFLILFG